MTPSLYQIDFFDGLYSSAETIDYEGISSRRSAASCETWDNSTTNDYGDFVGGTRTFKGGSSKDRSFVSIEVARLGDDLYYAFGASDGVSASFQSLSMNNEQTDGIYDGVEDILRHVSSMLKEFCTPLCVNGRHIDKALNDFRKELTRKG